MHPSLSSKCHNVRNHRLCTPFSPYGTGEWQRWHFRVLLDTAEGRSVSQVVSRRPLTAEGRVHSQANPCGILVGHGGSEDFLRLLPFSLLSIISPTPHAFSSNYLINWLLRQLAYLTRRTSCLPNALLCKQWKLELYMCARGQMWLIAVSEGKTLWWAGSRRLSTSHTRVRFHFGPSAICGTQSVTGRIPFSNTSVFLHQLLFHQGSLLSRHQRLAHCVHQRTRTVSRTHKKNDNYAERSLSFFHPHDLFPWTIF